MSKYKNLDKKIQDWDITEDEYSSFIEKYEKNKENIKKMGINILSFSSYIQAIEALNNLENIYETNRANKEAVPREFDTYQTNQSKNLIKLLMDNGVNLKSLRNMLLGSKKYIKSPEDLDSYLSKEYFIVKNWSKNFFINKTKESNSITLVKENEDYLIVSIENYHDLKIINATQKWCITREEECFNNYKKNYGKFYMKISYNLPTTDKDFLWGFNVGKNIVGFNNNNNSINEEEIKKLYKLITNEEYSKKEERKLNFFEAQVVAYNKVDIDDRIEELNNELLEKIDEITEMTQGKVQKVKTTQLNDSLPEILENAYRHFKKQNQSTSRH